MFELAWRHSKGTTADAFVLPICISRCREVSDIPQANHRHCLSKDMEASVPSRFVPCRALPFPADVDPGSRISHYHGPAGIDMIHYREGKPS